MPTAPITPIFEVVPECAPINNCEYVASTIENIKVQRIEGVSHSRYLKIGILGV